MQKILLAMTLTAALATTLGACGSDPKPATTVTTTRTTVTTTAPAQGACQAVDEDGNAIAVPC